MNSYIKFQWIIHECLWIHTWIHICIFHTWIHIRINPHASMPRLGRYCQGEIAFAMNRDSEYGDALRLTLVFRISHRRGPSYLRNQQRCRFANSSLHLAGLEIRLRNQATTESLLRIPVQPKRQTSTLTLSFYRRRPRHQSCAPSTNCPIFRRRRTGAKKSTTIRVGRP